MDEVWRDIVGYEGRYAVSSHGRVESLPRILVRRNGSPHKTRGRIIKATKDSFGYMAVSLRRVFAKDPERIRVHILVLSAFVGPRPRGYVARHLDDNPLNNNLNNLAWGTKSENYFDAIRNGIRIGTRGEGIGCSKLKERDVLRIRELCPRGKEIIKIAEEYKVTPQSIGDVIRRKTWAWL